MRREDHKLKNLPATGQDEEFNDDELDIQDWSTIDPGKIYFGQGVN